MTNISFLQESNWYFYNSFIAVYQLTSEAPSSCFDSYKDYLSESLSNNIISSELYNSLITLIDYPCDKNYVESINQGEIDKINNVLKGISLIKDLVLLTFFKKEVVNTIDFWEKIKMFDNNIFSNDNLLINKIDYNFVLENNLLSIVLDYFPRYFKFCDKSYITKEFIIEKYDILSNDYSVLSNILISNKYYYDYDFWLQTVDKYLIPDNHIPIEFMLKQDFLIKYLGMGNILSDNFIIENIKIFNLSLLKKLEEKYDFNSDNINIPFIGDLCAEFDSNSYLYLKYLLKYPKYHMDFRSCDNHLVLKDIFPANYDFMLFVPYIDEDFTNMELAIEILKKAPYLYSRFSKRIKTFDFAKACVEYVPGIFKYMTDFHNNEFIAILAITSDIINLKYVSKEIIDQILLNIQYI